MKMKKLLQKLLVLLLVITPFALVLNVKADSGWDSDYDSGGSSDWCSSSSDWSSSSSDWDSSSDDGSISFSLTTIIFVVIVIVAICMELSKKKEEASTDLQLYQDVSEDKLKEILPNLTLSYLKNMAFDKFVEIQNAWMEFDYDKLRELCTDELYNSYTSQLDVLKIKNGKNIMSDFKALETKIIDIVEQNGNVSVKVYMRVSFYDYVIDTTNNAVTRGNKNSKIVNNYVMTFVRSKEGINKDISCPNCGAPIKANTSGECEYCGSTIVKDASDFVLSKKTNINK